MRLLNWFRRKPEFTCPKCGAPQRDLMPHSDLCYRCYWAIMLPLMRKGDK